MPRDFTRLWLGQAISKFGSGITGSALPLAALIVLGASPTQMGLLGAVGTAPVLVVGLFGGVWVDRVRRRQLMIWADLGRAALLASIPAAWLLGGLGFEQLLLVAALTGVLTVLFDVAYQSVVPELVGREHIVAANTRLATVDAMAEITTPGLAGLLVQAISAPFAILLDALSFVASAISIGLIRARERIPEPPDAASSIRREITEGLALVFRSPLLRSLAAFAATRAFFGSFIGTLYALYALREVGLDPVMLVITIGIGGASNLIGAALVSRVTRRFGIGPTMLGAAAVGSLTVFLIPLASTPVLFGFAVLCLGQATDAHHPLYDVNALSIRQIVTPDHQLGRVNASMQVLEGALLPFGALVGGLLGEVIGVRATLFVAAAGIALSFLWLLGSPLAELREPSAHAVV